MKVITKYNLYHFLAIYGNILSLWRACRNIIYNVLLYEFFLLEILKEFLFTIFVFWFWIAKSFLSPIFERKKMEYMYILLIIITLKFVDTGRSVISNPLFFLKMICYLNNCKSKGKRKMKGHVMYICKQTTS